MACYSTHDTHQGKPARIAITTRVLPPLVVVVVVVLLVLVAQSVAPATAAWTSEFKEVDGLLSSCM